MKFHSFPYRGEQIYIKISFPLYNRTKLKPIRTLVEEEDRSRSRKRDESVRPSLLPRPAAAQGEWTKAADRVSPPTSCLVFYALCSKCSGSLEGPLGGRRSGGGGVSFFFRKGG